MTYRATYQTSQLDYHAYVDAPSQQKAERFFTDWEGKLKADDFVFALQTVQPFTFRGPASPSGL